ncbi:MAG TPA: tail fiber domain-containing protein [Gemmatimonas sp.]|uniref:tail fiber domain-containing protein n=1 Tax=Gemmatimonas sp. TaxID=1962908 RepID=UPI002ED797E2
MSSFARCADARDTARRFLPRTLTLAALTLASALTSTPAEAQAVFHACYVPASGTVYRIKAANTPANCLQPTHVAFSWTDGTDAAVALQNAVKTTDIAAGDVTGVFSNLTVGKLLGRALATTPPSDGQVLAWNASTSRWEAKTVAAGGGSGISDHGALTGLGDDDHSQYLLSNGVRTSSGFVVRNPTGASAAPLVTQATDPTLMWAGSYGALRAGFNAMDGWTASKIGGASASFGDNNEASGWTSFSTGSYAKASGQNSVAMGQEVIASGNTSVALGNYSRAIGSSSTALSGGQATGTQSLAWKGIASAQHSFAFGDGAIASGSSAFAIGGDASGQASLSLRGIASGSFSGAIYGTASGSNSIAVGRNADTNGHPNAIVLSASNGVGAAKAYLDGHFVMQGTRFWMGNSPQASVNSGRLLETSTGAFLSGGGVWTNTSDSTKKANFHAVDGESVLSKLAALPVYTWNYTAEDTATRHMGPTAQAFRAAFNLGDTDKAISTVDIDGVAVAGVKALELRTKSLKAETIALREENAALTARLSQLEALVTQLASQLANTSRNP